MDKLGKILGKDLSQGIMSRMLMVDVKENETTSLTLAQTKANGTYVRMLDANGNTVKVARDTFIQAIRDLLPSVLADQDTNGKNFLTLLTDGTLGKTTLANAASVLGALEHATVRDNTTSFDDLPEGSIRLIGTRNEGRPDGTEGSLLVCITFFKPTATSGGGLIQVAFKWLGASATAMTIYVRQTNGDGIFCPWNTLSLT